MGTIHKIIQGDCRYMKEIDNQSVQLVITSPPYWQLKDYGTDRDIGFHHSYQDYINHLSLVWQETHRVLEPGCRLCINIGDQYARSLYYGRYKVIPIRTEIIKCCESLGFDYMGAVIWQKIPTINTSGGATVMGSYPYPRNGILKLDYEFILIFKKPGATPKQPKEIKDQSQLSKEEWNLYFSGHWNFPGVKQRDHLAMFPPELPYRLIKMFSFVGDWVLDPFAGSGTTACVARSLQRNSLGYEINPDFIPLIREKFAKMDSDNIEIDKQQPMELDFKKAISQLPYIFKDPVQLNPQVDPRKNSYGSKIYKNSKKEVQYHLLKKVESPINLILKKGISITLLGIKILPGKEDEAMDYLIKKLKGKNLYFKTDPLHPAGNGYMPCYLYLKNKTFINAHLLKEGLADVDREKDYRYKKKFIKLVSRESIE